MSGALDEIIQLPIFFIIVVILDYVAWEIFTALIGGFAILPLALLVFVEGAILLNFIREI